MNPWLQPWWRTFSAPLSGDVAQDIAPVTSWFSPQLEVNFAGDREVESKVVGDVASYGRQLGILMDAVLELAEGDRGDGLARLQELAEQVEQVKQQHREKLEARVRADLKTLQQRDPDAFKALMKEYR